MSERAQKCESCVELREQAAKLLVTCGDTDNFDSMPPDDSTFLQQKTAVAGFPGFQGGPKGDNNLGYIQDYTLIP